MAAFMQQFGDPLYYTVAFALVLTPVLLAALLVAATFALLRVAFGVRK